MKKNILKMNTGSGQLKEIIKFLCSKWLYIQFKMNYTEKNYNRDVNGIPKYNLHEDQFAHDILHIILLNRWRRGSG